MSQTSEDFGLAKLDVKLLIEWMKADLGSSNVGIRNAAIGLLGVVHKQLGPGLIPMLMPHVKPALMTTLNDTFKNNPLTKASFSLKSENQPLQLGRIAIARGLTHQISLKANNCPTGGPIPSCARQGRCI